MTYGELKTVFEENEIPLDTELYSDSGWECDPTFVDGIYYSEEKKAAVFVQDEPEDWEVWKGNDPRKTDFVRIYIRNDPVLKLYPDWAL